MKTTNSFAPPVSPFKLGLANDSNPTPPGHVLSATGRSSLQESQRSERRPRLDKLKRDLIALLGMISFARRSHGCSYPEKHSVQQVQDHVRVNGGLVDVLNLTQLDESNPCELHVAS